MKHAECESCAAKPGAPTLCAACLHNRAMIHRLSAALRVALDGWTSASTRAGWTADLPKIEVLRKVLDVS